MGTVITKQLWYEAVDNFNIIQFWGELIKKHSGHLRSCVIFGQLNWLYDSQIAVNLNFSHDKKYAYRTIGNICWRRLPSGKFMTIKYEFDQGHFFPSALLTKSMLMFSVSIRNEIILYYKYDILSQPLTIDNLKFENIVQMRYLLSLKFNLIIQIVLICIYLICDLFQELISEFSSANDRPANDRNWSVSTEQGGYVG